MSRRSGLGRGLSALIPTEVAHDPQSHLRQLPLTSVVPNPNQPRGHFDEESLASLAASIRELGLLQPVLVRETGDGTYELIAGERRWRAAKRAGLQALPALIRSADTTQSLEQALVENLHREDLNPLEEAAAYQQLIEDFGLTHEEVATRVGRSRVTITNALRLFQLPAMIQKLVNEGELTAGHARALLSSPDRSFQEVLARRAVAEGMSVRAVEDAVREHGAASQPAEGPTTRVAAPGRRLRPPGVLELEKLLSGHLSTRVSVQMSPKRGRVLIEFADLDDLERIYLVMTGRNHQNG